VRTVVVGAGLSGLLAARTLAEAGHDVVVVDKGRSPGGRLATRRIGAATLDHGAQFFTVRSDAFGAHVARWQADGLVREWHRGFGAEADGHPRYVVEGGMNQLAKHLATGLDVRCDTLAFAVRPADGGWDLALDDGSFVAAGALVLTCPLPQTLALLVTADVELPEPLRTLDYDRTLALLAVLDGPSAVPEPGGVQLGEGTPLSFVADNAGKGISAVPALTLHAGATWSLDHWDADRDAVHHELLAAARPWLGDARVVESQVKRWRFATPRHTWPAPCWTAEGRAPLVLAGDAFAGPRVEGAALSGLAAAAALC
jgi:predicted NAD/FAD-dependent oxidoreductase